jgi:hypothetical protein
MRRWPSSRCLSRLDARTPVWLAPEGAHALSCLAFAFLTHRSWPLSFFFFLPAAAEHLHLAGQIRQAYSPSLQLLVHAAQPRPCVSVETLVLPLATGTILGASCRRGHAAMAAACSTVASFLRVSSAQADRAATFLSSCCTSSGLLRPPPPREHSLPP